MWGVPHEGKLLISTDAGSGKTKRLNNTPRVTIQKCDALDKVHAAIEVEPVPEPS